jgi:hypothetical protein
MSKREGGLGVRCLVTQNRCLQVKLLHRLHSDYDAPWSRWNWDNTQGLVVPRRRCAVTGPHWRRLVELMPLYRSITAVQLGDGAHASFWHDAWLSETPLAVRCPVLLSHAVDVDASVHSVFIGGLEWALVPRLTDAADRERGMVASEMATVTLYAAADRWTLRRCHKRGGALDVGALYHLCMFGGVEASFAPFVWENSAPSKVRVFAWLLVQARILSRASLLKKKILTAVEAVYPICKDPDESASHIIFHCTIARQFWAAIGGRHPPGADVRCLHAYDTPLTVFALTAPTFMLLCCWNLWKHRNAVAFREQRPCLALLLKNCCDDAQVWRARVPALARHEANSWLCCLGNPTTHV